MPGVTWLEDPNPEETKRRHEEALTALVAYSQELGLYDDDGPHLCGCGRHVPCRHCPIEESE